MRIMFGSLRIYILSLKRLLKIDRLFGLCLIMTAMLFCVSCKNIESIEYILEQKNSEKLDPTEIEIEEWQTMKFGYFSNYENTISSEHIRKLQVNDNELSLIPIKEFQYEPSWGYYFSFYLVDSIEQKLAGILPPPISLYEKDIGFIKNIIVQDLNNDALEDILIEFNYMTGIGEFGAVPKSSYEIYFQTGEIREYFNYEKELSENINEIVMNETILTMNENESSYIPDIYFVIDLIKN